MHARSAPTARTGTLTAANRHRFAGTPNHPESGHGLARPRLAGATEPPDRGAVRAAVPADRERRQIPAARRAPLVAGLRHER